MLDEVFSGQGGCRLRLEGNVLHTICEDGHERFDVTAGVAYRYILYE